MKILITNDDGIDAEGLRKLAIEAVRFGEVWIVAPDGERSCASHSLTIRPPLTVYPVEYGINGVHAYKCSGLPTDCVRIAVKRIMPSPPDAVFSGINNGFNAGTDIQYSATVGAALDAAMFGFPVIAFSEGFLNDPRDRGNEAKVTEKYLPVVLDSLLGDLECPMALTAGKVINVNFPDCPLSSCEGILWNRKLDMDTSYLDDYEVINELPGGGISYDIKWVDRISGIPGSDMEALVNGYVSVGYVNNLS